MRAAHEANVERGAIATLATKRVDDTTQFGVAITDEEGRIQGFQEKPEPAEALSDLANCGIYMFRREIFDHFPPPDQKSPAGDDDQPPGFVDWAMDVFPSLLDGDIPFYSHEIDAYWNDIGSVGEFVQGNLDALAGKVGIEPPAPEVSKGVYVGDGSDIDAAKVKPPVLIGRDCQVGLGSDLHGPVVVGNTCRLGAEAMLRDCVVLPGAEVPAGALVVGGLYGIAPTGPWARSAARGSRRPPRGCRRAPPDRRRSSRRRGTRASAGSWFGGALCPPRARCGPRTPPPP